MDLRLSAHVTSLCALTLSAAPASAETTILYANDFENPNRPIVVDCGNSLDWSGINTLYGAPDFQFAQLFTVEAIMLRDPQGLYALEESHGGGYAIGMLSTREDDRLALTFDVKSQPFVNVGMDISAIDVRECGGPFGVATPKFRISLLDSPGGNFDWSNPVLDSKEMSGSASAEPWSFHWSHGVVGLSTRGAQDGIVTVVFDLLESGYAAFDNLSITASTQSGIVDTDLDGRSDDEDNCIGDTNPDQNNADDDKAGDACDPAPDDPEQCGDLDGDGYDDCLDCEEDASLCPPEKVMPVAGATAGRSSGDAANSGSGGQGAPTPEDAGTIAGRGNDRTDGERESSAGCGCSLAERSPGPPAWFGAAALIVILACRQRRRRTLARRCARAAGLAAFKMRRCGRR